MVDRLDGVIQPYEWGDRDAIADLLGVAPTGEPQAELWLGAHPLAPSRLRGDGRTLDEVVAADPVGVLGATADGGLHELPFLLKILAAAQPLSIQAHPTGEQARDGFIREERAGIPRDAPERIYRDPHHKPELICALTRFEAKCGFRTLAETRQLFEELDDSGLDVVRELLAADGDDADVLGATMGALLHSSDRQAAALVEATVSAAERIEAKGGSPFAPDLAWCAPIAARFPDDVGLVVSLLLNHLSLQPNEAVFLGAGILHAYLKGVAVEVMAASDNVVRGGLTSKHVDIDELVAIVDSRPIVPQVQAPSGAAHTYLSPVEEFSLTRLELGSLGRVEQWPAGPEIVLLVDGTGELAHESASLELHRGDAVFVAASDGGYALLGDGVAFRAQVGQPGAALD